MDIANCRPTFLTFCCLFTCFSFILGKFKFNNLGVPKLGQNFVFKIMAQEIRFAVQYRFQKKSKIVFLY